MSVFEEACLLNNQSWVDSLPTEFEEVNYSKHHRRVMNRLMYKTRLRNSLFIKALCFILVLLMAFSSLTVYAASPKVITQNIEVPYSAYNDSYSPDKEIKADNMTYVLKDFEVTGTEIKSFTVMKDKLKDKSYTAPEETFNPEDRTQTGTLEKTEFSENRKAGRTKHLSETVKLSDVDVDYTVPETRKTTYKDEETGENINATLRLSSSEKSAPYWKDFGGFKGSVTGYDGVYYYLKNSDLRIPKNENQPEYSGYEGEILKSLGLGSDYRITGSKWKGDPYMNSEGVLCRDCEYLAEKKVCNINSVYSSRIHLPDVVTYTASSTYTDLSNSFYTITANYEAVKKVSPITIVISVAIGVLILAALISAVLVFLSKKKDKQETQQRIKNLK